MAKFHINPDRGPRPCSAKVRCPYGGESEHYATEAEAQSVYEATLARANPLPTHSKKSARRRLAAVPPPVETHLEPLDFEAIEAYAAASPEQHHLLDLTIRKRAEKAAEWGRELASRMADRERPLDRETLKNLRREFNAYKDATAVLVEAHQEAPHYQPLAPAYDPALPVGETVATTTFEPDSIEWHEQRYNSVGGSDVGALAVLDFTPKTELMFWDRKAVERVEAAKLALPTPQEVERKNALTYLSRRGPLYRGTMWEKRALDEFAVDHPEYSVYSASTQYTHRERSWQRINLDGLLSDREDGEPNGILELKTSNDPSKWAEGVPLGYKAQVLYYLDATGYDYAKVGVVLNDGELRYFTVERDEPLTPAAGLTMRGYLEERVEPWFAALQAKRA